MKWFGWGVGGGLLPAKECCPFVIHSEGSDENVDDRNGENENDNNVAHYLRYVSFLFFLVVVAADDNEQNTRYNLVKQLTPK